VVETAEALLRAGGLQTNLRGTGAAANVTKSGILAEVHSNVRAAVTKSGMLIPAPRARVVLTGKRQIDLAGVGRCRLIPC
jgi:hypothetical protein